MKKIMVLSIGILLIILTAVGCKKDQKETITGYYLETENGSHLIISEESGPIVMSNQSKNDSLFDNLQTGDKIKITYDAINESYPGQTGAYSCTLIEEGTISNIPEETLTTLSEMGWIPVSDQ